MQYTTIALAAFAATAVSAMPHQNSHDITVLLQEDTIGSIVTHPSTMKKIDVKAAKEVNYQTLTVSVGGKTDKATRCSFFGKDGKVLTVTRGTNVGKVSAAMGNGKPWTIDHPAVIASIACGDLAAKEPAANDGKQNNGATPPPPATDKKTIRVQINFDVDGAVQREVNAGEAFDVSGFDKFQGVQAVEPATAKCTVAAGKATCNL